MFFYVSKLIWSFLVPTNFLLFMTLTATLGLNTRFATSARWIVLMGIAMLCVIAFSPLAYWVMRPLEERFPKPSLSNGPELNEKIDGIIILGGAVGLTRDEIKLSDQGARMTSGIALSRQFPNAKLMFTGGDGGLSRNGERWTESTAARQLFQELGVNHTTIVYEERSRNTYENALFSSQIIKPKAGERWVLVTSAFHMARAVGSFRKVGWDVIPYPVDYETDHRSTRFHFSRSASSSLKIFDLATKEWIGLMAYGFHGYTNEYFPAPTVKD
jgi:uncharacterized SAM-binding protein YcdF (DUF218 family)